MIGRHYCCKAIGRIFVVDVAEREELLALLPPGFVCGNVATVVGVVRRNFEDSLILFTREADTPNGVGTKRVYEMPTWAFSAWFDEATV